MGRRHISRLHTLRSHAPNSHKSQLLSDQMDALQLQIQGGIISLNSTSTMYTGEQLTQDHHLTGNRDPASILFLDNTQANLSFSCIPTHHIGIKLSLTTPYRLTEDIYPNILVKKSLPSPPAPETVQLITELNAPVLSVNYYLLSSHSNWEPYLGLGVMLTHFHKPKLKKETQSGKVSIKNLKILIPNSIGLVEEAGLKYNFQRQWSIGISVMHSYVNSKFQYKYTDAMKTLNDSGQNQSTVRWSFITYHLNLGYRFN